MRRFIEHFYSWQGEPAVEDQINDYAEKNHLKIITIAPMYGNGIYVLFEESDTAEVAPTADVVEVVRCKDCTFGEIDSEGSGCVQCQNRDAPWKRYNEEFVMSPHNYCSYARAKMKGGAE